MAVVVRLLTVVWRSAVEVVWGSVPARYDRARVDGPLSSTNVEAERARLRAQSASSTIGGGL